MADERSLGELGRDVDRHEANIHDIRREYLPRDVYHAERDADRARITRLEEADTTERTGNRTWLLGLVQTVLGVALAAVGGYLTARGGK